MYYFGNKKILCEKPGRLKEFKNPLENINFSEHFKIKSSDNNFKYFNTGKRIYPFYLYEKEIIFL
jgi:hypothetical protein